MGGGASATTGSPVCVDAGILVRLVTAQDDGTIRGASNARFCCSSDH